MNLYIFTLVNRIKDLSALLASLILVIVNTVANAQNVVVLPGNSNYSQSSSPQGAVRFQRGFYLITSKEMKANNLPGNTVINSIGFTIGAQQNRKTKGSFKVYLQNTTDTVSRIDTAWRSADVTTSTFTATRLLPGNYEWQVRTNCSTPSAYSNAQTFANALLGTCNVPSNFSTTNITTTSATFQWVAPASFATKYYVEYKANDTANWTGDSTTSLTYTANGLKPDKSYQWRVKTICSALSSDFATNNFVTDNTNACNSPTNLISSSITNTSVKFKWNRASGTTYSIAQYRRKGTSSWINSLVFSDSTTISSLSAGTTYEWRIQTVCAVGKGAFIAGTDFTTTGTTQCYPPNSLSTDNLTDSSATFSWTAIPGATSYTLRYRLKEAISWSSAFIPMTLVHNDSITIPDTTGSYSVAFKGGSSFSYTSNGVYVAWEYKNASGALSSPNTNVSTTANTSVKGVFGQDSLKYNLSFISRLDTSLVSADSILLMTTFRPETIFGTSTVKDSVEVAAVYALGNSSDIYSNPTPVSTLIKYLGTGTATLPVTLLIKDQATGTQRFTETKNVAFTANSRQVVTFTGWSPLSFEKDSIIVTVAPRPGEDIITNNRNFYIQNVNRSIISFDDGSPAVTSAGLDSLAGLTLIKQSVKGCARINAAQIYLTPSAKGKSVYAVALNSAGAVIAKSSSFTPDSSEVNSYHSFYFPSTPTVTNADFYVGLAQTKGTKGLRPVGVQWENGYVRASAYFTDSLNGGHLEDRSALGRLMIRAEIIAASDVPVITGNAALCSDSTILTAVGKSTRFANAVIAYSSQNSNVLYSALQALGSPDVYPSSASSPNNWTSKSPDGQREFLELGFSNAAPINYVDIFETANPGAIDSVFVKNESTGVWSSVYTSTAKPATGTAKINHITFGLTTFNVSAVRLAINSPVVSGYNSIDAVSIGVLNTAPAFTSYKWMPGNISTQAIKVTSPGTYTVTVSNAASCSSSDSIKVYAPVIITPTITASKTSFCPGDSIVLKSSQVGGNTWSTGSTKDSIYVKTAASFTLSYDDGSGCGIKTSSPVTTTINPLPIVSISGQTAICPGGSTTLDAGDFSSYKWSTGATTRTITASSAATYSVTVTNASGCKGTGSAVTTISANPTPAITGILSFCPGGSTSLNAGTGYSSYAWTGGTTTATKTVSAAGTYTVTVTNTAGCSGSASASVSTFTLPTPNITGANGICPSGSTTLTANAGYAGYLWSGPSSATTQSINATATGSYSVTVTDDNGCVGTSATKPIVQYSNPTPTISGTLSFCGGASTTLEAGLGYGSYLWSTGETNHSIAVTTVQTFNVVVTDNHGCSGSASATTTSQNSTPATPGPISGPSSGLCVGNYVYSIASVTNASYYDWTVPNGISIVSGQGTTSVTINVSNTFTTGTLIVAASNSCGQSPSLSPRTFAIQAVPATPGAISGPSSGVCGATSRTYSINSVASVNSYTWSVPAGATITSGQGTTSVVVSFAAGYVAGNICVKSNSACGSSSNSCLVVAGIPPTPGAISGIVSVCSKQKNVSYSVQPVPGATSYTWTVPALASVISGQGTSSIVVNYGSKSGNITVKANSSCGSSGTKSLAINTNCTGAMAAATEVSVSTAISPITQIIAYPNPSNGIVRLRMPPELELQQYKFEIFDANGKRVLANIAGMNSNNVVLDLKHLAKGLYVINVLGGKKSMVVKVMLQ